MKSYLAALLAVGLLAGGSAVRAQAAPKQETKGKATQMAHSEKTHNTMMALQASAIRDAQAAAKRASANKPNRKLVERDATRSRDALQKVLKHLQDAESSVAPEMKEDVTKARGHEEEALKHAEELVTTAKAAQLDASAVKTHADAVVEHARAAEDVMKAHHEGMAKGAGMEKGKEPKKGPKK